MKTLWQRIFGTAAESSNQTAKSRLHFVLVQDRTGLTNDEMASFKGELLTVIERYFEIEKDGFDISYRREDEETALVINSPVIVKKAKRLEVETTSEAPMKDKAKKESKPEASSAPAA